LRGLAEGKLGRGISAGNALVAGSSICKKTRGKYWREDVRSEGKIKQFFLFVSKRKDREERVRSEVMGV